MMTGFFLIPRSPFPRTTTTPNSIRGKIFLSSNLIDSRKQFLLIVKNSRQTKGISLNAYFLVFATPSLWQVNGEPFRKTEYY